MDYGTLKHHTKKDIKVHLKNESHVIRERLKEIESKLNPEVFVRTHKSFIVNMNHVKELNWISQKVGIIKLTTGRVIKLSPKYKQNFMSRFDF